MKRRMKEMAAERARIDAAMEQIDAAKSKAKAQREEYAKFLTWKVKMQRKERQQREIEENEMRRQVDEKLQSVLTEHRQQRKKDYERWNEFARNPKPKPKPLKVEGPLVAEAKREAARREEMKARREEELAKPRPFAVKRKTQKVGEDDGAQPSGDNSGDGGYVSLPYPSLGDTDQQETAMSLSSWQMNEIKRQDKAQKRLHRRVDLVNNMFDKAINRRLYAMGRMVADPPADYQISTDLTRYIPADVLEPAGGEKRHKSPRKDETDPAFFLTSVADLQMPDPEQKASTAPHGKRGIKWQKWDPKTWKRSMATLPPIPVRQERIPEEEQATYEWYRTCHVKFTRSKHRAGSVPAASSHQWTRHNRVQLTPKAMKFDR